MLERLLRPVRYWRSYRHTRRRLTDIQKSGATELRSRYAFTCMRPECRQSRQQALD